MKKPAPKKSFSTASSTKKFSPRASSFNTRETSSRAPQTERSAKPFRKEYTKRDAPATSSPKTGYQGKASNFNPNYYSEKKSHSNISGDGKKNITRTPYVQVSKEPRTNKLHTTDYTKYSSLPPSADSGSLRRTLAPRDTSWGKVADWYNKHLETNDDTYHVKVVFPNVLRMLGDITGKKVLDLACGQGIFSEKLRDQGALVTGVDLGKQLIKIAEENSLSVKQKGTHKVTYHVASADDLYMLKNGSLDIVVCILALQNIDNLQKTIIEASRVLTADGRLIFVLNHPSFRNPRKTFWAFNEEDDTQYRRVDEYMSESHIKIDMTPGSVTDKKFTVSFHRPLQVYVKALSKAGFTITHLEEWISHKESEKGPKQRAENKSRKEIPMFMCIEANKYSS